MTVAGFCRNCLAKWLVLEARKISDSIDGLLAHESDEYRTQVKLVLDAFGYDDAAEVVYGCTYGEWKARCQVKVSDEQM